MSAEATGWVWRSSPYTGTKMLVALAVADVVNDAHGNEFWMTTASLAAKARVSRSMACNALKSFTTDGLLEVVTKGGGAGKATHYRWTGNCATTAQLQIENCATTAHELRDHRADNCATTAHRTKEITQENSTTGSNEPVRAARARQRTLRDDVWDVIVRECEISPDAMTRASRTHVGAAVRDILEATPDVKPRDVERVADVLRHRFGGRHGRRVTLRPDQIAREWPVEYPQLPSIDDGFSDEGWISQAELNAREGWVDA